jgi:hypothetical protein
VAYLLDNVKPLDCKISQVSSRQTAFKDWHFAWAHRMGRSGPYRIGVNSQKTQIGLFFGTFRPWLLIDLELERIAFGCYEEMTWDMTILVRSLLERLGLGSRYDWIQNSYSHWEGPWGGPYYVCPLADARNIRRQRLRPLDQLGFTIDMLHVESWNDLGTFRFTERWIPREGQPTSEESGYWERLLTIPEDCSIFETFTVGSVRVYKIASRKTSVVALCGRDESGQLWAHLLPPLAKTWPIEACERWLFQLRIGEEITVSS